jgi:hypothetical protein
MSTRSRLPCDRRSQLVLRVPPKVLSRMETERKHTRSVEIIEQKMRLEEDRRVANHISENPKLVTGNE